MPIIRNKLRLMQIISVPSSQVYLRGCPNDSLRMTTMTTPIELRCQRACYWWDLDESEAADDGPTLDPGQPRPVRMDNSPGRHREVRMLPNVRSLRQAVGAVSVPHDSPISQPDDPAVPTPNMCGLVVGPGVTAHGPLNADVRPIRLIRGRRHLRWIDHNEPRIDPTAPDDLAEINISQAQLVPHKR